MANCLWCKKLYFKELDGIRICEGYRHLTFEEKTHMSDDFQCDEFEGDEDDMVRLFSQDGTEDEMPKSPRPEPPKVTSAETSGKNWCKTCKYEESEALCEKCGKTYFEGKLLEEIKPTKYEERKTDDREVKLLAGLKPKKVYKEERIDSILDTMECFSKYEKLIPREWIRELRDLIKENE